MRARITAVVAVIVGLGAASAPAASAGTPGHWSELTNPTASNIDEVSLARTGDGVLHAAWSRPTPLNPGAGRDLMTVAISPGGSVGTPVVVQSNWASMENPSLVATGGEGLEAFVGGMRSTNFDETNANLSMLTSSDGGGTWALYPFDLTRTGAAYSSDVAAVLGAGATPSRPGEAQVVCVSMPGSRRRPRTTTSSRASATLAMSPGLPLTRPPASFTRPGIRMAPATRAYTRRPWISRPAASAAHRSRCLGPAT